MALAVSMFRWLDLLEKEFDKAFVDLDVLLGEIDPDDQIEITQEGRQKLTALSSSFAQLAHKSQTIFQMNAKMEAEQIVLRSSLTEAQAKVSVLEKELKNTLLQLHAVQLQLHSSGENITDSSAIKTKLENELTKFRRDAMKESLLEAQKIQSEKENEDLRKQVLQLQGEVYGARLAAKYLDKELAGRIQQIQILCRDLKTTQNDMVWNQIEAEIHLHRHKTVIRACRGPYEKKKNLAEPAPVETNEIDDISSVHRKKRGIGDPRLVRLHRDKSEGLGVSITGGKEHGVPIIISEIHGGMPAERCKELYVGDAILSVNNKDLNNATHAEAVHVLSRIHGDIAMEVLYVNTDDSDGEDDWEGDDNLRYSTIGLNDDPAEASRHGLVYMRNSPGDPNQNKRMNNRNGDKDHQVSSGLTNGSINGDATSVSGQLHSLNISTKSPATTPSRKYPGNSKRIFTSENGDES